MGEESQDKYPRVTQAQLELWLSDPTTQKYLMCCGFACKDIDNFMSHGGYVHMTDPNITHLEHHRALTRKEVYSELSDPATVLNKYVLLEAKEVDDEAS